MSINEGGMAIGRQHLRSQSMVGEVGDPDEPMEGPSDSQLRGTSFLTVPTVSRENSVAGDHFRNLTTMGARVQALTTEEVIKADRLRHSLRFNFMNPHEKWKVRRQFPWKLFLQLIKIIIVTTQLYLFGTLRTDHIKFIAEMNVGLRHIFLQNWTSTSDVLVYPPAAAPYSVYTVGGFYDSLGFAVQQFYDLKSLSLTRFHKLYSKDPGLSAAFFKNVSVNVTEENLLYYYDTSVTREHYNLSLCRDIFSNATDLIRPGLKMQRCVQERLGFSDLMPPSLIAMKVNFTLATVHVSPNAEAKAISCYHIVTSLDLDNSEHSGQVIVELHTDVRERDGDDCTGTLIPARSVWTLVMNALDFVVMFVCMGSMILCLRAVIKGHLLRVRTEDFFLRYLSTSLDFSDKSDFYNLWFFLMILNDSLIVLGTLFKMSIDFGSFNQQLFTGTTMLLGVGTLFVWTGVLRYLGFFSHYNVLIKTMKKSFPNVLRFMVCAGLLYFGFLLCGWIVLGPYSIKFKDALSTSECLFALINGDDMFATFFTVGSSNAAVKWFSRVYLYIFISIFIYVVLSLFISIIMDAYEVIKAEYNESKLEENSKLWDFIKDCTDTPAPGNYEATEGIMSALCNTGCAVWLRDLHPLGRGTPPRGPNRAAYEEIGRGIGSATESDEGID